MDTIKENSYQLLLYRAVNSDGYKGHPIICTKMIKA